MTYKEVDILKYMQLDEFKSKYTHLQFNLYNKYIN